MGIYLMEITTLLTFNKKVYSSKWLSTTHVQKFHCDLMCVLSVFKVCLKCVLQVCSLVILIVFILVNI